MTCQPHFYTLQIVGSCYLVSRAPCPQIAAAGRFLIESIMNMQLSVRASREDSMNGRQQEYQRLIAPIEDRMMRAVWRIIRDPDETEDAFQEALLTIWKRWDRICTHPNPQALILQICIHAAHDVLRRKVRRGRWLEAAAVADEIPDPAASAIQSISAAEQDAAVFRAIGSLSRNQARAILMHAVEEVPYNAIAAAMDCREATVRKHVARARAKLRVLLSQLIPAVHKEESHA